MCSPFESFRHPISRAAFWTLAAGVTIAFSLPATASARSTEVATVFSHTYNGYKRIRLDDNSFKPETVTFAPGGQWKGFFADKSIDDLPFMRIVRTIAPPLRTQKYVTATDPNKTDLVIFVYWGTTMGAEDGNYSNTMGPVRTTMDAAPGVTGSNAFHTALLLPPTAGTATVEDAGKSAAAQSIESAMLSLQTENIQRDMNNWRNARILGYAEALNNAMEIPWLSTSEDVVQELEMDRYFVVLRAFDFQELWKHKRWKLAWETIYSISERGNRFDQQLPNMTATAAPYFGQSRGLVREIVPEGRVQIGAPEEVPQEKK